MKRTLSPTLSRGSVIQNVKLGDVLEICNRIILSIVSPLLVLNHVLNNNGGRKQMQRTLVQKEVHETYHVFHSQERIIHSDYLHSSLLHSSLHHQTPNAAKPICIHTAGAGQLVIRTKILCTCRRSGNFRRVIFLSLSTPMKIKCAEN